jgi:nitroreductase
MKEAEVDHPINDLLQRRWSPRSFEERPVIDADLRSLFEAARWSASCFNDQPWYFIHANRSDEELYSTLAGSLSEHNRAWALGAPVLVLVVARTNFSHNGEPNRHALYDTGAAVASLTLEAMSRGLFVHQMAGFSTERARLDLFIPSDHDPVVMLAIGQVAPPDRLPTPQLRERELAPRSRRSVKDSVFHGPWGVPSELF